MGDDYDYDADGVLDMDDGWLYVEDEFDLADELAEGQIAEPGYCGTNYELTLDGFEFDLFDYWEDLEYADDPYFEYGPRTTRDAKEDKTGQKRKRGVAKTDSGPGKRRKEDSEPLVGESEPLIFLSRAERHRMFKRQPRPVDKATFSLLPEWRKRFADDDGLVVTTMPAEMKKAAEGKENDTPPKVRQTGQDEDMDEDDGEEGWEDEDEDDAGEDGEEGGIDIDPDMLKAILKEKLGAAGLEGMDEGAFMQVLQKMMSGDGEGDDAAGDLANALLGKVTSDTGDEALSGWLSGQGVALEDDDGSSVATTEHAEGTKTVRNSHFSPSDSAVSVPDAQRSKRNSTQMPLHSGSPSASSKKRAAPDEDAEPSKKKKVQFDVPPSSESAQAVSQEDSAAPTSEDPLMSEATISSESAASAQATNAAAAEANSAASEESSKKPSRKRKASAADDKPAGKKPKMKELQDLGPLPEAPSPAPPAKRTRSARAKAVLK